MSHPRELHGHAMPQATNEPPRSGFDGPRLELPRFRFAPSDRATEPARQSPPPVQYAPPMQYAAPMQHAPAPVRHAPAHYAPVVHGGTAPAPTWGASPTGYHAPAAVGVAQAPAPAVAPRSGPTPVAMAMASTATRPASVAWERVEVPAERTLLQRITPVHIGVLMVVAMVMMVVTSGPATMTAQPTRLSAAPIVDGGGSGVPLPARAGTTATAAAANRTPAAPTAGAKAAPATEPAEAKSAPRARTFKVGSARVRARVRAGGIPSPAASANLAIAGGGRVAAADTGSVRMAGIPSPAASEQLGPQTLPFRPTDGVTLPRATGERDAHAVDTHYAPTELAMEEPALPAMTPGASAAQAERQVAINQLSDDGILAPVAGGLAIAY